jgi:hypothetical protein
LQTPEKSKTLFWFRSKRLNRSNFGIQLKAGESGEQGDRTSFRKKIAQNVAQPILCQSWCTTFTVEKSSPIIWTTSVIKNCLGRKFVQSGHPDWERERERGKNEL